MILSSLREHSETRSRLLQPSGRFAEKTYEEEAFFGGAKFWTNEKQYFQGHYGTEELENGKHFVYHDECSDSEVDRDIVKQFAEPAREFFGRLDL